MWKPVQLLFAFAALSLPGAVASAQSLVCEDQAEFFDPVPAQNERFGIGLDAFEDQLFIGAIGDATPGRVHVYQRSGGAWIHTQQLAATSLTLFRDDHFTHFGISVAIHGDLALVGAQLDNDLGMYAGATYAYERAGGRWVEIQKLFAEGGRENDLYGTRVALHGSVALVSAPNEDLDPGTGPISNAGTVRLLEFDGTTWSETARLVSSSPQLNAQFGTSLAMTDDTLVIGEPFPSAKQGAVYVYELVGSVWTEVQRLTASNGKRDNYFGISVDIEGDRIVVGAMNQGNTGFQSGAAYEFTRDPGGTWVETERISPSFSEQGDRFGECVVLDGQRLFVSSSRLTTIPAGFGIGGVHVFQDVGGTWVQGAELRARDGAYGDWFGARMAVTEDSLLVGAYNHDPCALPSCMDAGAVYDFAVPRRSVSFRNGGTNPASYTAGSATPGEPWTVEVDLTTTGHSAATVAGYSGPASIVLGGGQVLLVGGSRLFRLPGALGPTASWTVTVPPDCALIGATIHTQAIHLGGVSPWALSNAQDLDLGF